MCSGLSSRRSVPDRCLYNYLLVTPISPLDPCVTLDNDITMQSADSDQDIREWLVFIP